MNIVQMLTAAHRPAMSMTTPFSLGRSCRTASSWPQRSKLASRRARSLPSASVVLLVRQASHPMPKHLNSLPLSGISSWEVRVLLVPLAALFSTGLSLHILMFEMFVDFVVIVLTWISRVARRSTSLPSSPRCVPSWIAATSSITSLVLPSAPSPTLISGSTCPSRILRGVSLSLAI